MVTEFLGDLENECVGDRIKALDVCGHEDIDDSGTEFCGVCGVDDLGNCGIEYLGGVIKQLDGGEGEDLDDFATEVLGDCTNEDVSCGKTEDVEDCANDAEPTRSVTVTIF